MFYSSLLRKIDTNDVTSIKFNSIKKSSGEFPFKKNLSGHSKSVFSLTVLPNGLLASGSDDNTIKIWDTDKGICVKTLSGHSKTVYNLTVLPNGLLASG